MWSKGAAEVEVVNSYKYLGSTLTAKVSATQAEADFIPKAQNKVISALKALRKINCTVRECPLRSLMAKIDQRCCTPLRYGVQAELKLLKKCTYLPSRGS